VLGTTRQILVASPELTKKLGSCHDIASLKGVPTISMADPVSEWVVHDTWEFSGSHDSRFVLEHQPRLTCRSAPALLEAVKAGIGVGLLLEQLCEQDLQAGRLVRLWPDWQTSEGTIYLVFTTDKFLFMHKCIEQVFGWGTTVGRVRQPMYRDRERAEQMFPLTQAAYNLTRMRTLAAKAA
jgi:DNA-binding transcriptional LysR family regulator